VQEQDNRPFLVGGSIFGEKNLIFVVGIVEGESAIKEAGVGLLGQGR
jgi:hypothetical protein